MSGNPWIAVQDPSVKKEINTIHIPEALSTTVWKKLIAVLECQAAGCSSSAIQYRITLAACLLMDDSGLRCEEVATVRRSDLIKSTFGEQVYECRVAGKGNKNAGFRSVSAP